MPIVAGFLVVLAFMMVCVGLLLFVGAVVSVPMRWLRERTEYDLRRHDRDEAEVMIRAWLTQREHP